MHVQISIKGQTLFDLFYLNPLDIYSVDIHTQQHETKL